MLVLKAVLSDKAFRVPIGLKAAGDGPEGSFSAVIALLDTPDLDGEVVRRSFFQDGQRIPIAAYGHNWDDWPIGDGTISTTADAAIVNGQLWLDTEQGRNAYASLKRAGELQQWSFGFTVTDEGMTQLEGKPYRELLGGQTHEASPVFLGAQPKTHTLSIKRADVESRAQWSASYINSLPDSAFALIEGGGSKDDTNRTTPRSLRHFPHHDAGGAIDMPHLRNALARVPQSNLSDSQQSKANAHLNKHMDAQQSSGKGTRRRRFKDVLVEAPEDSREDIAEDIAEAFCAQYAPGCFCQTVASYDSYAYVMVCGPMTSDEDDEDENGGMEPRYFRVDYVLDATFSPTLGPPQEVEAHATFTPLDMGEAPGLGDTIGGLAGPSLMTLARRTLWSLKAATVAAQVVRRKEGRAISSQRRARLADLQQALIDTAELLAELLDETKPPEKTADKSRRALADALLADYRSLNVEALV